MYIYKYINILFCFVYVSISDVDVLIAPIEHSKLTQSLQDLLLFVCDYAHDRCLKLLIARGKVKEELQKIHKYEVLNST